MIDIRILRDNPDFVKKNYLRRRQPELLKQVDEVIVKDQKWRKKLKQLEGLNQKRNKLSIEVSKAKASEKKKLIKEVKELKDKIEKKRVQVEKLKKDVKKILLKLPNIIHESVPYGKDDEENVDTFNLFYYGNIVTFERGEIGSYCKF